MPLTRARLKISDYSRSRMHKSKEHHKRVMAASLSLTSMVDMFAILVIFLLSNSSTIEDWVKLEHGIELPHAHTTDEPKKAATLQVAEDAVYDEQGKEIVKLSSLRGAGTVPVLQKYLKSLKDTDGFVNLVADKDVPFGAMKRLVLTCHVSGFKNVNLAVFPRGT